MSTKQNPLRAAMQTVQHADTSTTSMTVPAKTARAASKATSTAPSRIGKRSIGGHFDPEVSRQLKMLAAELERKVQDLVAEALNDLFRKYNKSAVA